MLGFLKPDPRRRIEKAYRKKLEEAVAAQRSGKIEAYAALTAQAEALAAELDRLEAD